MDTRTTTSPSTSDFYRIWNACFGDDPEFIDEFYRALQPDITAYTLYDPQASAILSRFRFGELVAGGSGLPVDISYAIGTDPSERGKGYGATITRLAADDSVSKNALSVLSPANQDLVNFYEPLEYTSCFYKQEIEFQVTEEKDIVPAQLTALNPAEYGETREVYLTDRPHIALNERTLEFEYRMTEANPNNVFTGFFKVQTPLGDCLLTIEPAEEDEYLYVPEFLAPSNMSNKNRQTILSSLARKIHKTRVFSFMPADSRDDALVHGMAYRLPSKLNLAAEKPAWLGFAFD